MLYTCRFHEKCHHNVRLYTAWWSKYSKDSYHNNPQSEDIETDSNLRGGLGRSRGERTPSSKSARFAGRFSGKGRFAGRGRGSWRAVPRGFGSRRGGVFCRGGYLCSNSAYSLSNEDLSLHSKKDAYTTSSLSSHSTHLRYSGHYQQKYVEEVATGESSQSEEEVWVERKVKVNDGKLDDDMELCSPTAASIDGERKVSISSSPHSDRIFEGPYLQSPPLPVVGHISQATPTTTPMQSPHSSAMVEEAPHCSLATDGVILSVPITMETERNVCLPGSYDGSVGQRSVLMSTRDERDETPPADIVEAEWRLMASKNDPQVVEYYYHYFQALAKKKSGEAVGDGGGGGKVKEMPQPEDTAQHSAVEGAPKG